MEGIDPQGLPDFILIGAQKSGTSSVHHVLAQHPRVYLPPGEIHFFDVDDVEQHPDFFVDRGRRGRRRWVLHDLEGDPQTYATWYRSWFREAAPGQLVGEDSTTYLASRLAPRRIAALLPRVKLVALLRDPVQRCYSHYWHTVSTGRATRSFEGTLRRRPGNLLRRGFYRDQLARYHRHFPAEQIKVVLFEDFVAEPQAGIDEVAAFLGLDEGVDLSRVSPHRNAANAPLWLGGRLAANRLLRPLLKKSYRRRIPNMSGYRPDRPWHERTAEPRVQRAVDLWETLRPKRRYPPMRPETRAFLEGVFRRANEGLSELIGVDVSRRWPWMEPGHRSLR
jgi:hypothetical protein